MGREDRRGTAKVSSQATPMCLLIVAFGIDPDLPLVVGANRDERLDRPALSMTVLRRGGPRILGGRDLRAGGTWLAVNEHGVVAGLTNRPSPDGPDPGRRSRGELPLRLARFATAERAAAAFVDAVRPGEYNPCWILVGDRHSLHYLDVTGGAAPTAQRLAPGVFILENNPLHAVTPKTRRVTDRVARAVRAPDATLVSALPTLLGDHRLPPPDRPSAPEGPGSASRQVRPELSAACVHAAGYGTRSSVVAAVPREPGRKPTVLAADGPPCRTPFTDAGSLWSS
jgi:uncharacterized protein with NRDE domain